MYPTPEVIVLKYVLCPVLTLIGKYSWENSSNYQIQKFHPVQISVRECLKMGFRTFQPLFGGLYVYVFQSYKQN